MIQLTRRGVVADDADTAALRQTFTERHCARLPGLLEPSLIADIQMLIARGRFREFSHGSVATELRLDDGIGTGLLHFLVNDPRLFRLVESMSGCRGIGAFAGRVYRRLPGGHHHDSWHGDIADPRRLIGMSVNLSREVYDGGVFEIREVDAPQPLATLPNVGAGDAILFRLSPDLEHRVTDVRGAAAKTAFAGWFFSGLDFERELRQVAVE